MQGRLSPPPEGRIQAFPWDHWREEFALAEEVGFKVIEWVLDTSGTQENPLLTTEGQPEISALSRRHGVTVESVCVDWLMERPLADGEGNVSPEAVALLTRTIDACGELGIRFLEIPLVDDAGLRSQAQSDATRQAITRELGHAEAAGVTVVLETDLPPREFVALLERFDPPVVRANFDMGNSASLGYDHAEELSVLGEWIVNVHVKDRMRGGGTVPLGDGDVDLRGVFSGLGRASFQGTYILQTARQPDDVAAARAYRDQVLRLLETAEVTHGP